MTRNALNLDLASYGGLERLGRVSLSKSFHMREFLYSEVAVQYQLRNVPDRDRLAAAVEAGSQLCCLLLEPLQDVFGRVHVRSGYRSRAVNQAGVDKHNCAQDNDSFHTWDHPHPEHGRGATACISIPAVSRAVLAGDIDAHAIGWWIVDNLPDWSFIEFFSTKEGSDEVCFNLGWHERSMRRILSWRGGPRNLHEHMPDANQRRRASEALLVAVSR